MCHISPTATLFSAVMAACGSLCMAYHAWHYNRLRCLWYKNEDLFRWIVTWCLFGSSLTFTAAETIATYVKYNEYYIYIPKAGITIKPYPLWSAYHRDLFRGSYWLMAAGIVMLLAVHLEEVLFWGYLITTIKSQRTQPWFRSIYFKLWVAGVVTCTGIVFGAAGIETEVLTRMEVNIYFSGSVLSILATIGSVAICWMFPEFIKESNRQGANPEVAAKLQFFKSMHNLRAVFRVLYTVSLLIIATDGLTSAEKINHQEFWTDIFFAATVFCIFAATMLSLVILLPRSMQEEAGYHRPANIFVRQAYQVTSAGAAAAGNGQAHNAASYRAATTVAAPLEVSGPWAILGERLNLEKDEVRELIANNAARQEEEAEMAQGVAYDLAPLIAPEQEGRGRAF